MYTNLQYKIKFISSLSSLVSIVLCCWRWIKTLLDKVDEKALHVINLLRVRGKQLCHCDLKHVATVCNNVSRREPTSVLQNIRLLNNTIKQC